MDPDLDSSGEDNKMSMGQDQGGEFPHWEPQGYHHYGEWPPYQTEPQTTMNWMMTDYGYPPEQPEVPGQGDTMNAPPQYQQVTYNWTSPQPSGFRDP